jgi:hypothetical protein
VGSSDGASVGFSDGRMLTNRCNNDAGMMFNIGHGWFTANHVYDQLKTDFDYLYAEGERGYPKMM